MADIPGTELTDTVTTEELNGPNKPSLSSPSTVNSPLTSLTPTRIPHNTPNKFTPATRQYAAHLDNDWSSSTWKSQSNLKEMLFLLREAKASGEEITVLDNSYVTIHLVVGFIVDRRNQRIDDGVIKGKKQGKHRLKTEETHPPRQARATRRHLRSGDASSHASSLPPDVTGQ
jgi:hypothetical protein